MKIYCKPSAGGEFTKLKIGHFWDWELAETIWYLVISLYHGSYQGQTAPPLCPAVPPPVGRDSVSEVLIPIDLSYFHISLFFISIS